MKTAKEYSDTAKREVSVDVDALLAAINEISESEVHRSQEDPERSTVARTKGRMAGAKEWTISFPAPESRRWRKYGYVRTVWRNKAVCRPATATAQNHSRRIPPRY